MGREGDISPLYKDTQPELYDDAPTTRTAATQEETDNSNEIEVPGRAVYEEEVFEEEVFEEEIDVGVESEENRVIEESRVQYKYSCSEPETE